MPILATVEPRRAWRHRGLGLEDRGEGLVVDTEQSCRALGGGEGVGDHGGHALAFEAHDTIEEHGVGRVFALVLVAGGGVGARG